MISTTAEDAEREGKWPLRVPKIDGSSCPQQSRPARRETRRFDAGICSYSGWMWERDGAFSLAAAGMLPPLPPVVAVAAAPLKPLAADGLQPMGEVAVRGAEPAARMWQSCAGGGGFCQSARQSGSPHPSRGSAPPIVGVRVSCPLRSFSRNERGGGPKVLH